MRCAPPSSRKFPCAANSRTNKAVTAQPANPLHGVTLETMVTALSDHYGWEDLGQRIAIRCFTFEPSVPSSLKFLRKTPWAREKVESLYLFMLREQRRAAPTVHNFPPPKVGP
ncbi:VF530 family DNA-binding protein [Polaromonas sp.]|uniref:VF530 family protein n=1 Tax=Polaromonas sp. TaxID=1869339 RepID=UPI00374FEAD4